MTESFLKELDLGLCSLQLELSNEQKELLYGYYRMVIEKNNVKTMQKLLIKVIMKHNMMLLILAVIWEVIIS